MSRTRRRATLLAVLVAAAVCGVVAVVLWRQQATTPDGAICGSVWHWRPGHGELSGGQHDAADAATGAERCRQAAAAPFTAGLVLLGLAVAAAAGVPLLARRTRTVSPS